MTTHEVVSKGEWVEARKRLLAMTTNCNLIRAPADRAAD